MSEGTGDTERGRGDWLTQRPPQRENVGSTNRCLEASPPRLFNTFSHRLSFFFFFLIVVNGLSWGLGVCEDETTPVGPRPTLFSLRVHFYQRCCDD